MLLLLLGCPAPEADTGVPSPGSTPPRFTEVEVVCDGNDATWRISMFTDAWTGGGELWLSADGDYVEAHPFVSREAALDGSSDHLELNLGVVSDFRDVAAGSRTAFNCGTPELAGLLVVYATDAETVADCRVFGSELDRWDAWGFPTCGDEVAVSPSGA